MSSEVHKYIETSIRKKESLLNAKVIGFPNGQKVNELKNLETIQKNFWKINDKSNEDQLRAVTGICFMFGTLILMGLYSGIF